VSLSARRPAHHLARAAGTRGPAHRPWQCTAGHGAAGGGAAARRWAAGTRCLVTWLP